LRHDRRVLYLELLSWNGRRMSPIALISIAQDAGDFAVALRHARDLLTLNPADTRLRSLVSDPTPSANSRTRLQPGHSTDHPNLVAAPVVATGGGSNPPPAMFPRSCSIPGPQFHIERGLAPRSASLATQLPFERHQPRVARPPLQQRRVWNDRLVPAGMAAGAHKMEDAQVLEAEGVARWHGVRAS
jgi:hypothetical protein